MTASSGHFQTLKPKTTEQWNVRIAGVNTKLFKGSREHLYDTLVTRQVRLISRTESLHHVNLERHAVEKHLKKACIKILNCTTCYWRKPAYLPLEITVNSTEANSRSNSSGRKLKGETGRYILAKIWFIMFVKWMEEHKHRQALRTWSSWSYFDKKLHSFHVYSYVTFPKNTVHLSIFPEKIIQS